MAPRPSLSSSVEELRAIAYASIPSRSRRDLPRHGDSRRRRRCSRLDAEEGEIFSDDDDALPLPKTGARAKDTGMAKKARTDLAEANRSSHGCLESCHCKKEKPKPSLRSSVIDATPSSANEELTREKISAHESFTYSKKIDHQHREIPSSGSCQKTTKPLGKTDQKMIAELPRQVLEDNRDIHVLAAADSVGVPASMFVTLNPTSGNSDFSHKAVEVQGSHVSVSSGPVLTFESIYNVQKLCCNPCRFHPTLNSMQIVGGKDAFESRSNGNGGPISCTSDCQKIDAGVCVCSQESYPHTAVNQEKPNGISELQQWKEEENLVDKELEEAQQHRHSCEVRERLVRRQYRDAHGALKCANLRCETLYQKREVLSAKISNAWLKGNLSAPSGHVVSVEKQQEPRGCKTDGGTFEPGIIKKNDEENQAFQAPLTTSLHQH